MEKLLQQLLSEDNPNYLHYMTLGIEKALENHHLKLIVTVRPSKFDEGYVADVETLHDYLGNFRNAIAWGGMAMAVGVSEEHALDILRWTQNLTPKDYGYDESVATPTVFETLEPFAAGVYGGG